MFILTKKAKNSCGARGNFVFVETNMMIFLIGTLVI